MSANWRGCEDDSGVFELVDQERCMNELTFLVKSCNESVNSL